MTQATWLFTTAWRRQTEREEQLREQGENNGEIKETSQQEENITDGEMEKTMKGGKLYSA